MDSINNLVSQINAFVWGPPMLLLLGCTGVFLTVGTLFVSWRKVPYAFKLLFDTKAPEGEGEIKPFNALMTALSATVGTGNIAGVATAIAHWVTVEQLELDEGMDVWNRLVHDVLASELAGDAADDRVG